MLESIETKDVQSYREGSYEWVVAAASFAVDPGAAENARIADLALAPRHDGRVRFEADVRVLRPMAGANGRALVVVPNRGMLGPLPYSAGAPVPLDAVQPPEMGDSDSVLLQQGWTIAWCGWQWNVDRTAGWLGLDAPVAEVEPGWLRVEFRLDATRPIHTVADRSIMFTFAGYPSADLDDRAARLTVRAAPLADRIPVPRDRWRFADATTIELDGGFRAFHWYELVYRSSFAPVVGTGLLAVRDFASHLHARHEHVFASGVSQTGRFLRQFLFDGLNVDERGQTVFDGVFAHIAGARRGEFNCRFGQPSLTHPLGPAYGAPYDSSGLLARQRSIGGVPKVMLTNSAWEYWRGDGALVHQDARTGADLPEDPDARVHLLAGTDHFGPSPLKAATPVANPVHQLDPSPLARALFAQLVDWVCVGTEPSPSCVPRRSDATAVDRATALARFVSGHAPSADDLPWTPEIDPHITTWPLRLGEAMVALVSDVDDDGNERAGIRLPAIAAPVAAYTGWNPRRHVDELPDVLYEFTGSRLPLQRSTTLQDRVAFEAVARSAASALVASRFLLEHDVERTVSEALRLYDARLADAP